MVRKTSFVLVLGAVASPASATLLLYEPFNYGPVGTELSTADTSDVWLKVPATTTLEPTIALDSLTHPGITWTPAGNSVAMTGSSGGGGAQASSTRSIPGQPYLSADQPALYYSMLFRVNSLGTLATGNGSFVAGFRNNGSTAGLAGFEAGAPLLIRRPVAGSTQYELGTGLTQETGDRRWDSTTAYNVGDTLHLVLEYQFVDNDHDFARLYVNPDLTLPTAEQQKVGSRRLEATNLLAEDFHGIRDGLITNFFLRNNGAAPGSFNVDELRVASSWGGVMSTFTD